MPRNKLLQIRRGAASDWSSINPLLEDGEIAFDTDNKRLKIGNGNWNDLDYLFLNEIVLKIKNTDEDVIRKGQGVYINGQTNNIVTCKKYLANNTVDKYFFLGLTTTDIAIDDTSYVICFGKLGNVNTTGSSFGDISVGDEVWSFGDRLYVSSVEAGKLTNISQAYSMPVGFVISVDDSAGEIFVNPNGVSSVLNDLEDVDIKNIESGDFLKYNPASDLWINNNTVDGGSY